MNTRPKATGCIVTYNNADKIEKVVASILEQTRDLDFRLIISDNMSADGTADIIRQKFPQVTVVEITRTAASARATTPSWICLIQSTIL